MIRSGKASPWEASPRTEERPEGHETVIGVFVVESSFRAGTEQDSEKLEVGVGEQSEVTHG